MLRKKIHVLNWFALGHLMGPLGPADHAFPHQVLMSFNLDTDVTKGIVNHKKFFHLQMV